MKPSLFSLSVLFAFISSFATAQFVLDIEGNYLINGGTYYILPHIWALGGGLKLAKTGNETYPLSVVQSPFETDNGLPWRITSPLRIKFIPANTSLDFSTLGKVPRLWKWAVVEEEDGNKPVKIIRYENTLKGWFKIQQYNSWAYKIVFCPTNGDSCGDLGISRDDDGKRLLVITDDNPLFVVFVKAESSDSQIRASII
ncbi:trypsin inhibitor DE-3-like [Prosopis cineraria]|uniref:trypsin inhibitor DE-3-like n=1 Tax=Prosopis cineraria TaxID=364024 RepID=UPI00240F0B5E|nr:trypsin inhibitor DE-3-like [Prosopis cineraria]